MLSGDGLQPEMKNPRDRPFGVEALDAELKKYEKENETLKKLQAQHHMRERQAD